MLSPTGQFIVPSSCPAFLLVNFITEHLDEAERLLNEYKAYVTLDISSEYFLTFTIMKLLFDLQ